MTNYSNIITKLRIEVIADLRRYISTLPELKFTFDSTDERRNEFTFDSADTDSYSEEDIAQVTADGWIYCTYSLYSSDYDFDTDPLQKLSATKTLEEIWTDSLCRLADSIMGTSYQNKLAEIRLQSEIRRRR